MNGYPLLLNVAGRRALVVGGGPVAARRVKGLLDADADVHVVAPFVCEDIWDAAERGAVTLHLREFTASDLDGVWLVHTATGERCTDDAVARRCRDPAPLVCPCRRCRGKQRLDAGGRTRR